MSSGDEACMLQKDIERRPSRFIEYAVQNSLYNDVNSAMLDLLFMSH